jgi:hypothetical protein
LVDWPRAPGALWRDLQMHVPRARDSCTSYATENIDYLTAEVRAWASWLALNNRQKVLLKGKPNGSYLEFPPSQSTGKAR